MMGFTIIHVAMWTHFGPAVFLGVGTILIYLWLRNNFAYLRLRSPPRTEEQQATRGFALRARGVPIDWDMSRLRSHLAEQSFIPDDKNWSLSDEIDGLTRTATLSFRNRPPPLRAAQGEQSWNIHLPALGDQPTSQKLIKLDDGFIGITTLHAPPPEDHKVE
jgi:protein SERAC1